MSKPSKPMSASKKRKAGPGPSVASGSTLDDLTALTTAQLYSLSSRRHRDESLGNVRRAQEERDRAYLSLEQSQRWLERASEHLERMEENAKEAHKEYSDAKGLLTRVRLASSSAVDMMGGKVAAEELSDGEAGLEAIIAKRAKKKKGEPSAKSRKIPYIQEVIIDMAKRGELVDGKKLTAAESEMVPKKDRTHFVQTMTLVEELWTEEEELFLRSPVDEILESTEELQVIVETIALRCLTKLNEWEGRVDPTPTTHQKPSYVSLGTRARRIFHSRKKAESKADKETDAEEVTKVDV